MWVMQVQSEGLILNRKKKNYIENSEPYSELFTIFLTFLTITQSLYRQGATARNGCTQGKYKK